MSYSFQITAIPTSQVTAPGMTGTGTPITTQIEESMDQVDNQATVNVSTGAKYIAGSLV